MDWSPLVKELSRVVRAALEGWPQTMRLVFLLTAATAAGMAILIAQSQMTRR